MDFKQKAIAFLKNRYNVAFLIILVVALVIRLRYLFIDTVWPDEALYVWHGRSIIHNFSYIFSQEFGNVISYIPSLVIAFFDLFTSSFIAGRLMVLSFSTAGIIFVYLLGKELRNEALGLLAAILLSFNHLYWFYSDRVLLDVPLTTMFTFVAFSLVKYEKIKDRFWILMLAIAMALTIYTKNAGLLVLPFVGLYFILSYHKNILSLLKKKEVKLALIVFVLLVLPFVVRNLVQFGSVVPGNVGEVAIVEAAASNIGWFDYIKMMPALLTWYVIPFFILGLFFIALYRRKSEYMLLYWFILVIAFFSFISEGQPRDRYVLPLFPAVALISGIALLELNDYIQAFTRIKISSWILIIVAVALMIPSYKIGDNLVKIKSYSYTGFRETGDWFKENSAEESTIYTGSTRALRIFTDRDFDLYGGTLKGPPQTQEDFEAALIKENLPVYLVVDQWEYIQPSWLYPLTEEKAAYLESLGFKPVKVVTRQYPTQAGLLNVPAVVIFQKA